MLRRRLATQYTQQINRNRKLLLLLFIDDCGEGKPAPLENAASIHSKQRLTIAGFVHYAHHIFPANRPAMRA